MQNRGIFYVLFGLTLLTLVSCSSAPTQPDEQTKPQPLSDEQIDARVKTLVDQARSAQSPERESHLLEAADLLVRHSKNNWARNLLTSIDQFQLGDSAFIQYSYLLARVYLESGAYSLAEGILTNERLERQWATLTPEEEVQLRRMRARLFERRGETTEGIRERITLGTLLSDQEAQIANQEAIWQSLMTLSRSRLEALKTETTDQTLRGWYALAALSKNNQTNLERSQNQVEQWQKDWPQHPASRRLPNDLQLLQELVENQPRQVALLLPQQGTLARAGDAVRDGFMAAYYQALNERSQVPLIRQYDTAAEGTNFIDVYEQAVSDGAEFVIGPLDREKVRLLTEQDKLPVPVLTLNYTDSSSDDALDLERPSGLYQFGLAAEDEARQVARQAYLDGHRYALVITPDREWSRRSAAAFVDQWLTLGGDVVNTSQFISNSGYSNVIQDALLINDSQDRWRELTRLLGTAPEFEPRRRRDLDMIFLIASPEQGRQIKPTLAFHYAAQVPVYSTSHIYTGEQDHKTNSDLDGIRFNTLPWLFDETTPEKQIINEHVQTSAIYSRMHALGVDAFHLYPRLPQFEQASQARLYGATGTLQLLPGGRIEREQIWAEFRGGSAKPMTPTVGDLKMDLTAERP